jgi:hypothetical protein
VIVSIDGDNPDNESNMETGDTVDGNEDNDENRQVNDGIFKNRFFYIYLVFLDIPGEEQFDEEG